MFDIFVYGLLMRGEPGFDELSLARRAHYVGRERVSGTLYDLGDYPGLIRDGIGIAQGEHLRSGDATLLADLDAYELYDPDDLGASDYIRTRINMLGSGRLAWTYVYVGPLNGCSAIASGDWRSR